VGKRDLSINVDGLSHEFTLAKKACAQGPFQAKQILIVSKKRIAGLRGQPFVGPVSAPKRAFTLSEA
jgi:hypothetical protein